MAPPVTVTVKRETLLSREQLVELYATAIKARYADRLKDKEPALRDNMARQLADSLLEHQDECHAPMSPAEMGRGISLTPPSKEECGSLDDLMADLVLIREVDKEVVPSYQSKMKVLVGKLWAKISSRFGPSWEEEMRREGTRASGPGVRG